MTTELFIMSLVFLMLVLMVLMVLCWVLRHNRSRNLTELKISAGRPARILTIRTEPDHAPQLLDRLLDRVFLQMETAPESGDELVEESRAEPGEELGGECGSDPEVSTAASLPSSVNALHDKLWKWITVSIPPSSEKKATPPLSPPPPPPPSPTNQDQTDDLSPQPWDASQHAFLSSQGASCSKYSEEGQHDESQL